MGICTTEIRVKGKPILVESAQVNGYTVLSTGGWLKTAAVRDEELVEGEALSDPDDFTSQLKKTGLKADVFTFAEKLPDTTPRYAYKVEWDNLAIIPISTFSDWWEHKAESSVRRAVRKAAKSGVVVREMEFEDEFVRGIVEINNETPVRQGKPFWHYGKSFDSVKIENSTYPDRNLFLGAYCENELIGFMRLISVNGVANIIQILSKMRHFDKRPQNAMIAKAVEICEQRGMSHLAYCNYVYNDPDSSLTEFKRRNGFRPVLVPRYYVPLSVRGKVALKLNVHHGVKGLIPKRVIKQLLKVRSLWYTRLKPAQQTS